MNQDDRKDTEGLAQDALRDPEAFTALFRRLSGRLTMWINLRMGPALRSRLSDDDVLQETFLQAHRSLSDFVDQGPDSFRRWIFSVAENRLKDLHKFHTRQKRDAARELKPSEEEAALLDRISSDGRSPSSLAKTRELVDRLSQSIGKLPEELRDVLIRRSIEGRSFVEIAHLTKSSRSMVQARYVRALQSLKDELASQS